ncbi:MAG: dihydropteroate synthase [Candidatus Margulisiibacteriota bacterium]
MQILEFSSIDEIRSQMQKIGCDPAGINIMKEKALIRAIKLPGVSVKAALILKQEMLSLGGDAANHRETISGKIDKTDILLLGTPAHYKQLERKLSGQPFGLAEIGKQLAARLALYQTIPPAINLPSGKTLRFDKPLLMGILNCTPDSFSDGGQFLDPDRAADHAHQMVSDGALIIDAGGESSRPGADPVSEAEELKRVIPVVSRIADTAIVSIDTYKAAIAEQALTKGAQIINDITALQGDPRMAEVAAEAGCPVVLMHMRGTPQAMQDAPEYDDIMAELISFFEERISFAVKSGIKESNIIIDPGIGFGKTTEHNLAILNHLEQLKIFGRPVLLGASRKSVIGNVLGLPPGERLSGDIATVCFGIHKNVNIIRVHDVKEIARAVKMTTAILST